MGFHTSPECWEAGREACMELCRELCPEGSRAKTATGSLSQALFNKKLERIFSYLDLEIWFNKCLSL